MTATAVCPLWWSLRWHARFPDPTLGDAILDRLVHNAYRLILTGETQRKIRSPPVHTVHLIV
ncbi:MAG: ATP-binding protein [Anaerolineales bacterium]